MSKLKRPARRKPSTKAKAKKNKRPSTPQSRGRARARARKSGSARATPNRARKRRAALTCYYPGCKEPGAAVTAGDLLRNGMFCTLHKSLTAAERKFITKSHHERLSISTGVLTVERSLLKRNDPARKASYAGGNDFPTTVGRELGQAPELRRVGGCLEARNHLGLSQDEFAALIGKDHSTIEDWENGRRRAGQKEKSKRKPPIWLAEMFGAFLGAQAPAGHREIMELVRTKGALAACYMLMRSAFDGPRLKSAKTLAARVAVRPAGAQEKMRQLCAESDAECEAARAADPEGFAAIDAATVVYKGR